MRPLIPMILLGFIAVPLSLAVGQGDEIIDQSSSKPTANRVRTFPNDPGRVWIKESSVAVDAPPDDDVQPLPESKWSTEARRSGICGAVSPRAVAIPSGGFRLYYTQILPRPGHPDGANDYENSTSRILSAVSVDGNRWTPEPGVRLSPQQGGASDFRVVSSEVVPAGDDKRLRMYYECCPGPQTITNSLRSAVSFDGLEWTPEPGIRLEQTGHNYSAPRIQFLGDGRIRLYCYDRGHGIVSAVSNDGLKWELEPGVRISQDSQYDSQVAFAPEIFRLAGSGYVMYYAGYSQSNRAQILRATSTDGLHWTKDPQPVISPGPGGWDAAKCSEMCVIPLPQSAGAAARYRILYEACDGTAKNQRGVWRIASAVTPASAETDKAK